MTRRIAVLAGMATLLAGSIAAQSAPTPKLSGKTPGECTKEAYTWHTAQLTDVVTALRAAKDPEESRAAAAKYSALYAAVNAEARRAAAECGAQFNVETVAPSELFDLAGLYAFVRDTANARRATERGLTAKNLTPRQRGQALLLAINLEITRSNGYFGVLDQAERYVAQIDQFPDSLADLKLAAHQRMLGQYEYLDVDDGLRQHATAIIDLGRRLGKTSALTSAFLSLARSAADELHADSALMILDRAEKELGAAVAAKSFKDFRDRYALIGTRAAPVTGQYWLNVDGTPAPLQPGNGTVTFIEFTAHWCMPCKNSYPGVRSLAERFRGKPFQGVLVTSLYGYLGDRRNLNESQEVEADRAYFTQEHAIPFRIAVNPPPNDRHGQPKVDEDYRVGGIPQIIIVDKRGVIRQIVTGWDRGNTERIGRYIDRLLLEPTG